MQPNSVSSVTLITSLNFSIAVHGVYAEGTAFETCYRPSLREFNKFFFLLPFLKIFSLKICHKWRTIWSTRNKTYISLCIFWIFWVCGTYSLLWTFCCNCFQSPLKGRGNQLICSSKYLFFRKKNCWLGDVEEIICPCKESVAGKKIIKGIWGDFMCRIAAMGHLS